MKRRVIPTTAFERAARRLIKSNRLMDEAIGETLRRLTDDAFDPILKTHQLKGEHTGTWSCSGGYDLRIIFAFVKRGDEEVILLHTVGTHDQVY